MSELTEKQIEARLRRLKKKRAKMVIDRIENYPHFAFREYSSLLSDMDIGLRKLLSKVIFIGKLTMKLTKAQKEKAQKLARKHTLFGEMYEKVFGTKPDDDCTCEGFKENSTKPCNCIARDRFFALYFAANKYDE